MARIQKIQSDSSFRYSKVLPGTILAYKVIEDGKVKQKAKLPDGSVVEIPSQADLSNYYTIQQIDGFLQDISDSLSSIRNTFQDYYTKSQIDDFVENISDSLSFVKNKFYNYYTKDQIEELLAGLSNSLSNIQHKLENYYTIQQIDQFLQGISNSLSDIRNTFDDYYTKGQIIQMLADLSNSFSITDYYTKSQIDDFLQDISNSFLRIQHRFQNYYNIDQIDGFLQDISDSLSSIRNKFQSYYTKDQILVLIANLSNSFSFSLADYYTKQQTNELLDKKIPWPLITGTEGQFLKKTATGVQWANISSNSFSLSNYYTKAEVDALIKIQGNFIQISDASDGWVHLDTTKIPIGIQTNIGSYYPVEKQSVFLGSDSLAIDIHLYLAYDGVQSFTPPWKVWLLGAAQGSSSDLSNYYTKAEVYNKDEVDALLSSLSNSFSLSDYYTKEETQNKLTQLSQGLMFYTVI